MHAERTRYTVPGWGVGELWTSHGLVLAHEFVFTPVTPVSDTAVAAERSASRAEQAGLTPYELLARFRAFLAGDDPGLHDVALDLGWATAFQRAVAESLRAVPRGEVVSYGELAALAGYPGAHRAVGTFCARNRFAFLVPCHRVVAADGIGGYGSAGVEVKRRLLDLENAVL